jgi:hypothetical protein
MRVVSDVYVGRDVEIGNQSFNIQPDLLTTPED